MFDLFPKKKSVDEHLESNGALYASIKKEASDLASGFVNGVYEIIALKNELQHQLDENAKLLDEKKNLEAILKSIEEDGTEEHNNAIKLRQENAKLKDEIAKWEKDWDEQNKVIIHLNERVNEIDSDVNRDLKDEVFCLKNDYAVLRANHQIVQNNYKKCTEQRDEYNHQLNAANKEIEILKKDIQDYIFEKSDEYNTLKALYERAKRVIEGVEVDLDKSLDEQSDKDIAFTPWVEEPIDWKGLPKSFPNEFQDVKTTADNLEERFDEGKDILDYFKKPWKCKDVKAEKSWEEAASDLALRVIKLEKQIEELKIVNTTNPYSAMKPDGTLKAINCVGHIPTNGYVPSNQDVF
jgi:chromosome segregation ATPase